MAEDRNRHWQAAGEGVRSFATVTGGSFKYNEVRFNHPLLRGREPDLLKDLNFTIVSGFVERATDGRLHVVVVIRSPSVEAQRMSEDLGIDKMELWSESSQLSDDPDQPTTFSHSSEYTMPAARVSILNMRSPYPARCFVHSTVTAYIEESAVKGNFEARMRLSVMGATVPATMRGNLEAQVV